MQMCAAAESIPPLAPMHIQSCVRKAEAPQEQWCVGADAAVGAPGLWCSAAAQSWCHGAVQLLLWNTFLLYQSASFLLPSFYLFC